MATILCVDDERTGLLARKFVLEHSGYDVLTAEGGVDALDLFRASAVDAVVLDYKMPDMDGIAVAESMRDLKPSVPIIMLTATSEMPVSRGFLFDGFVLKGQSPHELLSELQRVLH
jgi:CheY-like chemotaxis protein